MATASPNQFTAWDYVVFSLVLAVSACIGVFYGCIKSRQKTTKEFLLANREMTAFPVSLSLLASFMSAITLLGTPAEIYVYGTEYWMIWLGYCVVIPMSAHVFIPIFYRLKITSVFEYLELRFQSSGLRVFGAVVYIIQMTLYMAIVLYAPSLALNAVTGLNVWISVFSIGIVCTFYTALGGMKAVMWTDVFQICMMFAGLFAVLIKGSIDFGGFGNIWRSMEEGDRIHFFTWDPNPLLRHNIWSLSIGGAGTWLAIYGVNQAQIQRALCTNTLKQAQVAMWINLPGLTALLTICSLCGMVVYAQYKDCDPLSTNRIQARDQLLPLYVMDAITVPGIPGLFTACLFSGALSTISSGLNSLSAVTLQDLVKYICFKDMQEERATLLSKILSIVFGVICIALTFVAAELGGVLQAALALFGMIGGPILGLYMLGIFYPCANSKGAFAGVITSLVLTVWLGVGANVYKPYAPTAPVSTECPDRNITMNGTYTEDFTGSITTLSTTTTEKTYLPGYFGFYEISYMWYSVFAVIVVHVIGLPVSILTGGNKDNKVHRKYLCPIFDIFCCCLPSSIRRCLKCTDYVIEEDDFDAINDVKVPNGYHAKEKENGFCHVNPAISDAINDEPSLKVPNGYNATEKENGFGHINPAISESSIASSLQYETHM